MNELQGTLCSCALSEGHIIIKGNYYLYKNHKRIPAAETIYIKLPDVMRVDFTKTYSRLKLTIAMVFGLLTLGIKAIPSIGIYLDITDSWSLPLIIIWSLPYQKVIWAACGIICLAAILLYRLSYRTDLEINTTKGRFLLPCKDMLLDDITSFQQEFFRQKAAYRSR